MRRLWVEIKTGNLLDEEGYGQNILILRKINILQIKINYGSKIQTLKQWPFPSPSQLNFISLLPISLSSTEQLRWMRGYNQYTSFLCSFFPLTSVPCSIMVLCTGYKTISVSVPDTPPPSPSSLILQFPMQFLALYSLLSQPFFSLFL